MYAIQNLKPMVNFGVFSFIVLHISYLAYKKLNIKSSFLMFLLKVPNETFFAFSCSVYSRDGKVYIS